MRSLRLLELRFLIGGDESLLGSANRKSLLVRHQNSVSTALNCCVPLSYHGNVTVSKNIKWRLTGFHFCFCIYYSSQKTDRHSDMIIFEDIFPVTHTQHGISMRFFPFPSLPCPVFFNDWPVFQLSLTVLYAFYGHHYAPDNCNTLIYWR